MFHNVGIAVCGSMSNFFLPFFSSELTQQFLVSFHPVHFLVLTLLASQCSFQVQLPQKVPGFSRDISLLSQTLVPVLHGFLFPGLFSSLDCSNLLLFQPLPHVMFILILKSPYLISFFSPILQQTMVSFYFFFQFLSENLLFFKSLKIQQGRFQKRCCIYPSESQWHRRVQQWGTSCQDIYSILQSQGRV